MITFIDQSGINNLLSEGNGAADNQVYFNTDTQALTLSQGTGSFLAFPSALAIKDNLVEEEMMNAAGAKYYWNANKIQGTGAYSLNPGHSRVGGTGLITSNHWEDNPGGQDRYIHEWYPCAGTGNDGLYLKQNTYTEQGYLSPNTISNGFGNQAGVYMASYADHFDFSPTASINQPATIMVIGKPPNATMWGILRFNNATRGFGAHYTHTYPSVNGASTSPNANTNYKVGSHAPNSAQLWIYSVSGGNADGSSDPYLRMRINGVETHSFDLGNGGPHVASPITLNEIFSHPQNAGWGGQGTLCEFAIFEGKILTDQEIAAFESFYSNKYNFTTGFLRLAS